MKYRVFMIMAGSLLYVSKNRKIKLSKVMNAKKYELK